MQLLHLLVQVQPLLCFVVWQKLNLQRLRRLDCQQNICLRYLLIDIQEAASEPACTPAAVKPIALRIVGVAASSAVPAPRDMKIDLNLSL